MLGGDRFEIGAIPPGASPDLKTWHIRSGNQNYFTYPNQSGMAADRVNQRLVLIDQLIAASPNNAVAVDSLNRAKSGLSPGRGSSP